MSDLVVAFERFCKAAKATTIADTHRASAAHFGREASPRCGNCVSWMTNQCPRERRENGRKRGPNCNGIACGQYTPSSTVATLRALEQRELDKAQEAIDSLKALKGGK